MDKNISVQESRKRQIKRLMPFFWIILSIVIMFAVLTNLLSGRVKLAEIIVTTVERGDIEGSVTATGIIVPESEQVITSPISSTVQEIYFKAGDKVERGQSILKLNQIFTMIEYEKQQDEYELMKNRKNQLRLAAEINLTDYRSELEIKNIRLIERNEDYVARKKLEEMGGLSKYELNTLEREISVLNIEIERLKTQITNIDKQLQADLNESDLEINIQRIKMDQLQRQMEMANAIADQDGIITWINDEIGSNINAGEPLVKLADLSSFKIEAEASGLYAERIKIGQTAKIKVNDQELAGEISNIEPNLQNNVLKFSVSLQDKSSSALRNNMKLEVYIITERKENVLMIENGQAINGSGKTELFVIKGRKAYKHTVSVGVLSFDRVEVIEGLQEGDKVIISDLEDLIKRDYLIIK